MSYTTIEFDQPRRLRFGIKAFKALDKVTGDIGIVPLLDKLRAIHTETLERVLWAGLLHDEPALTIKEVVARLQKMEDEDRPIGPLFVQAINAINDTQAYRMGDEAPAEGNAPKERADLVEIRRSANG